MSTIVTTIAAHTNRLYDGRGLYLVMLAPGLDRARDYDDWRCHITQWPCSYAVMDDFGDLVLVGAWL